MPIRKELRHHYRGPTWQAVRRRILTRARGRCEWCGKPDRRVLWVAPDGRWSEFNGTAHVWRDERGKPTREPYTDNLRSVAVVLTVAHLNHVPDDNRDDNLAALCQRCHLRHDEPQHRASRAATRRAKSRNLELTL